jgi:uncharacterized protein (TIGR02271 family)
LRRSFITPTRRASIREHADTGARVIATRGKSSVMTERARPLHSADTPVDAHEPCEEPVVIPVVEEALTIERAQHVTGRVRVTRRVNARVARVDVPLVRERVHVTRTRVERAVSSAPPVRHEGDTLVIPVVEERVVVEKRLFLREEIRITRERSTVRATGRVRLRAEEVEVERIDESGAGGDGGEPAPRRR